MWFRRRAFGGDYSDTVPKWHLVGVIEGKLHTAACEYSYDFYYESPMLSEENPPRGECCRKCLATLPSPHAQSGQWRYIVRFPTAEEQSRGMLVVPRHKRKVRVDENAASA